MSRSSGIVPAAHPLRGRMAPELVTLSLSVVAPSIDQAFVFVLKSIDLSQKTAYRRLPTWPAQVLLWKEPVLPKQSDSDISAVVRDALLRAGLIILSLGSAGRGASGVITSDGRLVSHAELAAENEIIAAFRKMAERRKIGFRITSSVHGVIPINDGPFIGTAVIRGLAGPDDFTADDLRGEVRLPPVASMCAVFTGDRPTLADCLASGIVDQRGNRLIVASRNHGTELSHLDSPGIVPVAPSGLSQVVYTDYHGTDLQSLYTLLCRAGYTVVGTSRPPVASFLDVASGIGGAICGRATSGSTTASICGIALVTLSGGVTFDLAGANFADRTIGSLYNDPIYLSTATLDQAKAILDVVNTPVV